MAEISFVVNGVARRVDVEPETPLLWVLRDALGLTGTKFGCGMGVCGACTVHRQGRAVRSCQIPAGSVSGQSVVTIEGLGAGRRHPCQQAWLDEDVAQCGYCQPGMIMATAALLSETKAPTEAQVDSTLSELLCRCGSYDRIRKAVARSIVLTQAKAER